MELSAYEECLDLMQFYEAYCSKESSVIEGNADGVLVIVLTTAISFGLIKMMERQQ